MEGSSRCNFPSGVRGAVPLSPATLLSCVSLDGSEPNANVETLERS